MNPEAPPQAPFAERGHDLDPFQREAARAVAAGRSVVVGAPTGAGKTVVAEEAIRLALGLGRRLIYTTPIKALSNQKYRDLAWELGSESVGLVTGDHSIKSDAPVVVMTTEVLRNMMYSDPERLAGIGHVVLDEVHYLQDRFRGPVWEEVIIGLPRHITLVCLSATVSNLSQLGEWIEAVRGPTEVIEHTERPVPLAHHLLVADSATGELRRLAVDSEPGHRRALAKIDDAGGRRGAGTRRDRRQRPRSRWKAPRRTAVVEHLASCDQLPAILFVFSRQGCGDASRQIAESRLRLVSDAEQAALEVIARRALSGLAPDELQAIGAGRWRRTFARGVAPHHAGLLPSQREAAEEAMTRGLLKVVTATETLALGVNVPARSVIIEQISKYDGEGHRPLTPAEYTQLAGRAGRRGLDDHGHAIVLWSRFHRAADLVELVESRSYPLDSAFRVTYNMAANLIAQRSPVATREFLDLSFAQFQTDAGVVRREARIRSLTRDLEDARALADEGDVPIDELLARRRRRRRRRDPIPLDRDHLAAASRDLRPGDIAELTPGEPPVGVVSIADRRGQVRIRFVTTHGATRSLDSDALTAAPKVLERIELDPAEPQGSPEMRSRLAAGLSAHQESATLGVGENGADPPATSRDLTTDPTADRRADPTASSPSPAGELNDPGDVNQADDGPSDDERLAAHKTAERLALRLAAVRKGEGAGPRRPTVATQFVRVHRVLEERAAVSEWNLSDMGSTLAGVFHERDLLIAEALAAGAFDGLDEAELAGVASLLTYESRPNDRPAPSLPGGLVGRRAAQLLALHDDIASSERAAGLPLSRDLDTGFVDIAMRWAAGGDLSFIAEAGLTGGDFVRNVRQLVDCCRQIASVADGPTAATAAAAARALSRSVLATPPPSLDGPLELLDYSTSG